MDAETRLVTLTRAAGTVAMALIANHGLDSAARLPLDTLREHAAAELETRLQTAAALHVEHAAQTARIMLTFFAALDPDTRAKTIAATREALDGNATALPVTAAPAGHPPPGRTIH